MADGHDHHAGPPSVDTDRRALSIALVLLVTFMVFEVGAAIASNSLVLLADAGHMLVDVGAIAGSLVAIRLAARPETGSHTYGMKRAEILAAAGNAIALLIVSALVTYDAVVRLVHPSSVDGAVLIVVAAVGVAVNVAATMTMARANRRSLNVEGAYRHILTDLYGFIGTLLAGSRHRRLGLRPGRRHRVARGRRCSCSRRRSSCCGRRCASCLEATPDDIDVEEVRRHLMELPEVQSVHDLHAWTLTSSLPVLTAHVVVTDECFTTGQAGRVLDHLQDCLSDHFDVAHSTLQFESPGHLEHELGGHA